MSPPIHDVVIQFPPGRVAVFLADRDKGHRAIMSILPDGLGPTARSATNTLWRVEESTDLMTVRSTSVIEPGRLGRAIKVAPLVAPAAGVEIQLSCDIACQKTPPSDVPVELRTQLKQPTMGRATTAYRSRMVIVPEPERVDWAGRRLDAVGLSVATVEVSDLKRAELSRRGGAIPYVTVKASATVRDAAAFGAVLTSGIGKGRNFGLGLIQISTTSDFSKG